MSAEILQLPTTTAKDAEISLLGAAMLGYGELADLLEMVDPDDFWHPLRGEVWSAIGRLHRQGIVPDLVSVARALVEAKVNVDASELGNWIRLAPVIASAPYYAELVVTAAGMRNIRDAGTKLHQISERPMPLAEAREAARQAVDEATVGKAVSKARMLADMLDDVIDVAENGTEEVLGTGWEDVDRFIGGIAPGRLLVIGARPGVGKSLAGTNLALHVAHKHGHAVHIASLEMPEREVGQRLLAAHAEVGLNGIQTGRVPDGEWGRISQKMAELNAMPISVDDAPGQTITHIRSAARNLQRRAAPPGPSSPPGPATTSTATASPP